MKQYIVVLISILNTVTAATYKLSVSSNVTLQNGVLPLRNDTATNVTKRLRATEELEFTTLEPPVIPVTSTLVLEENTEPEVELKPVEDRKLEGVKLLTNDPVIKTLPATEESETKTLNPLVTPDTSINYLPSKTLPVVNVSETTNLDPLKTKNTVSLVTSINDPFGKTLRAIKESETTTSDPLVTPTTVKQVSSTNDTLSKILRATEEPDNTPLELEVTSNILSPVSLNNDPLKNTLRTRDEPQTRPLKPLVAPNTVTSVNLPNDPLNETLKDTEEPETTTLKLLVTPTTETSVTLTNVPVNKILRTTKERETTTVEPLVSPGTLTSESQDDTEPVEDRKLKELEDDDKDLEFNTDLEDEIEQRDESFDSYLERIQRADLNDSSLRMSEIKCKEYISERNAMELNYRNYNARWKLKYFIGGRNAFPFEFPHMAAIGWKNLEGNWAFKCGGTLISSKFVLTAAHCTKVAMRDYPDVTEPNPKIVRIGDLRIDFKEDYFALAPLRERVVEYPAHYDHKIDNIIVHPKFKPPKQYYDIALIELESHLNFKRDQFPACLWNNFDTSSLGMKATASGWGVLHPGPFAKPSPILQAGELDIIDSQTCDHLLRPSCNRRHCGVAEHQICAGILAGGVDACQGDSGGPLQIKMPLKLESFKIYYVIGVTSFGKGCARENSPGVYTRVSSFVDWIEDIVWPK